VLWAAGCHLSRRCVVRVHVWDPTCSSARRYRGASLVPKSGYDPSRDFVTSQFVMCTLQGAKVYSLGTAFPTAPLSFDSLAGTKLVDDPAMSALRSSFPRDMFAFARQ
jgi:hypothetical protein